MVHFISRQNCLSWAKKHYPNLPFSLDGYLESKNQGDWNFWSFDENSDVSFPLAKTLTNITENTGSRLLWITEYGIWISLENRPLYQLLRMAVGSRETLSTSPGHLFSQSEPESLQIFVDVALRFRWGGMILCEKANIVVSFSHDGELGIIDNRGKKFDESINKLGLKKLELRWS